MEIEIADQRRLMLGARSEVAAWSGLVVFFLTIAIPAWLKPAPTALVQNLFGVSLLLALALELFAAVSGLRARQTAAGRTGLFLSALILLPVLFAILRRVTGT